MGCHFTFVSGDWTGLHVHHIGHWDALGEADLEHLVDLGSAADDHAHPLVFVYWLYFVAWHRFWVRAESLGFFNLRHRRLCRRTGDPFVGTTLALDSPRLNERLRFSNATLDGVYIDV